MWIVLYFRKYYHPFHRAGHTIPSSSIDIPYSKLFPPMTLSVLNFQSYYSILLAILYSFSRFLLCSFCLIFPSSFIRLLFLPLWHSFASTLILLPLHTRFSHLLFYLHLFFYQFIDLIFFSFSLVFSLFLFLFLVS